MAVEKVEVKSIKSRRNVFGVPQAKWQEWGTLGRQIFNEVYSAMVKNQRLFIHPKQPPVSRAHWKTTAWNAAWIAADATR